MLFVTLFPVVFVQTLNFLYNIVLSLANVKPTPLGVTWCGASVKYFYTVLFLNKYIFENVFVTKHAHHTNLD